MLIRLNTKTGHIFKQAYLMFKKNLWSRSQIQKLPQNDYANDLRKTIPSPDREHHLQQNFLGVK